VKAFLSDRLNTAWLASALVLAIVILLVPNDGAGSFVLIAVAAVFIGLSGAVRIRDARRDRERRRAREGGRRRR
jgi:uncharacterized membrane protein HdeD (DUF308 family)